MFLSHRKVIVLNEYAKCNFFSKLCNLSSCHGNRMSISMKYQCLSFTSSLSRHLAAKKSVNRQYALLSLLNQFSCPNEHRPRHETPLDRYETCTTEKSISVNDVFVCAVNITNRTSPSRSIAVRLNDSFLRHIVKETIVLTIITTYM